MEIVRSEESIHENSTLLGVSLAFWGMVWGMIGSIENKMNESILIDL